MRLLPMIVYKALDTVIMAASYLYSFWSGSDYIHAILHLWNVVFKIRKTSKMFTHLAFYFASNRSKRVRESCGIIVINLSVHFFNLLLIIDIICRRHPPLMGGCMCILV